MKTVVIIGGGAAGFFAAINCAEKNPGYNIIILEKSPKLLAKVEISGGGRCNVTHACFDARQLVKYYPRGEKQLLGPFTKFNPAHTVEWFENRGIPLKTEEDGRMFPATDSSLSIINCFLHEARKLKIEVRTQEGMRELHSVDGGWLVKTTRGKTIEAGSVIITTGGSVSTWKMLAELGHTIVPPVASLFTFNINDARIKGLEGISVPQATVTVTGNTKLQATGPVLVTHWGLSGPGILRLSAWGARYLAGIKYSFEIAVNWAAQQPANAVNEILKQYKEEHPKQIVGAHPLFSIPTRLWEKIIPAEINGKRYADLSNKLMADYLQAITATRFKVTGKSTFKDEFVTAGGVDLNEVDFRSMQSKKFAGLYFAGEVLDIDAITGGFNFQSAWTTGYIAGSSA